MTMTWRRVKRVSYLFFLVAIIYGAYSLILNSLEGAQEQRTTQKAEVKTDREFEGKSFIERRNERDVAVGEIGDIEKALQNLNNQKSSLESADFWEKEYQTKKKDPRTPPWMLQEFQKKKADALNDAGTNETLDQVNKKIVSTNVELNKKRLLKDRIESDLFSNIRQQEAQTNFRTMISIYFIILIALVIAGFYFVALRDKSVVREIFSGQAGIQFITLFSLVIAIILFGIMNILEGKELAALLGGLSGYILGRTTSSKTEASETKTPVLSSPSIASISPNEVTVGQTQTIQIVGNGLQLANSVKIVQGANEVLVSDIMSNDQVISCKVTLNANQATGSYDVIVTASDGAVAKLPQAFTVK